MRSDTMSPRQAQLVEAAMRIIATKGSRRFTAQLLADEVGVTPGAIYRHFPSLNAIVDAVVDRVGALLFADVPPDARDPIPRLGAFFRCRCRAILANPALSRLLLSDHLAQAAGGAQAKRLEGFRRRSRDFVAGCLREAAARGQLAAGIEPDAGAVIVLGSILALCHSGTRIVDAEGFERLAEAVWAALERALRRRAPAVRRPMAAPARVGRGGSTVRGGTR
ncbi:MAG TPA: TetR/AcrR family transcriptional regulator [Vicinamibacterales bacterium]|nr:TetR/AcrR family transcriptional regulator [Vicinamibacterales bacterium]